jgi:TonB-linked SusC/RagA family outer membrane protein
MELLATSGGWSRKGAGLPNTMILPERKASLKRKTRSGKLLSKKALSLYLVIAATLPVAARSFSQNVQLSGKSVSLEKAFAIMSRETGYEFMYEGKILEGARPVSVHIRNEPLEAALKICLKDQPYAYFIKYKTVVIREADTPEAVADQAPSGRHIRGTVTDSAGKGLPGISVAVKGSKQGTSTDGNGDFELPDVPDKATLVFSGVNYKTRELTLTGGEQVIRMQMVQEIRQIDAVILVGYATQKKVDLTGSVSTLSGNDLALKPLGQTAAGLEGELPGVTVTQGSGQPGADGGTIRVRGIGTMDLQGTGKNDPLILVDGAEANLNNIDPNLIASVTVLKDAASSSIYGSRAANGVILVTTRRARGSGLSLGYNAYFGWQRPTNLPKIVDGLNHMLLTNEAYENAGNSPLYSDALIQQYRTQGGGSSDSLPNTDWQKATLTGSGFEESHFLTVSGGTDKIHILASAGYLDQNGIIPNSNFKRLTLRENTDIVFSRKFSMQFDLQFLSPVTTEPSASVGSIFHWMNGVPPTQLAVNSNGTWGTGWNGANPVAASKAGGVGRSSSPSGTLNASFNYQPVSWLTANFAITPRYTETYSNSFRNAIQTYLPNGTASYLFPSLSSLSVSNTREFFNNMRGTLTFNKAFGAHHLKILGGTEEDSYNEDDFSGYRDTYVLPEYPVLSDGGTTNMSNTGTGQAWTLLSFFGRINYDYKEKYLLEVNARDDGSSRFAEGHKWGFFPSVSAGWRISQEDFMLPLRNEIDELKLRASWGELGNQNIGTYPSVSAIQVGSYSLGGQTVSVAALNSLANANITWETTEMSDIGLDVDLFNHLSVTADYYVKNTRNILLALNIPLTIGLSAPYQNAGKVSNKGWEVDLNYHGKVNDFTYNIGFNLSDVINKVVDMHGILQTGVTVDRPGYSINSIFGYQAQGYFKDAQDVQSHATQFGTVAPGDLKYKDQNNDNVINVNDQVVLGSTIPRFTYGLNAAFSWKRIDLNMQIQGVGKEDGLIYGTGIWPFYVSDIGGTVQQRFENSWTPQNPNAAFPRLVWGGSNTQQISSFWMKSAAYARLKNIQIGYTLPSGRLQTSAHLQSLRLFVNGSNLFTRDKFWPGYDVETPVGQASDYPIVKVYSFGVNVNF